MKIYFATSRSISNNLGLNRRGAVNRLLSFYMCQNTSTDEFTKYKKTGLFSRSNRRKGVESDDQVGDR